MGTVSWVSGLKWWRKVHDKPDTISQNLKISKLKIFYKIIVPDLTCTISTRLCVSHESESGKIHYKIFIQFLQVIKIQTLEASYRLFVNHLSRPNRSLVSVFLCWASEQTLTQYKHCFSLLCAKINSPLPDISQCRISRESENLLEATHAWSSTEGVSHTLVGLVLCLGVQIQY